MSNCNIETIDNNAILATVEKNQAKSFTFLFSTPPDTMRSLSRRFIDTQEETQEIIDAIVVPDLIFSGNSFRASVEFPLLYLLYKINLDHKPIVVVNSKEQMQRIIEYFEIGLYGIKTLEDIVSLGYDKKTAKNILEMKLSFTQGSFSDIKDIVDFICINYNDFICISEDVFLKKKSVNEYIVKCNNCEHSILLDDAKKINIPLINQEKIYANRDDVFSIIHCGDGDGWNPVLCSMSSVINTKGNLYLMDMPDNIDLTLANIGISINDLEGIIHTHVHDDHTSGIMSLLSYPKRLKYIATPLVKECVNKKVSIISPFVDFIEYFFDYIPLVENKFIDIDGMQIRAFFSAHPVDNACYEIRVYEEKQKRYKTYAHLADICSFEFLNKIKENKNIDLEFINQIEQDYKKSYDIKKVDVGEGLIHGNYLDFQNDKSNKIRYSHLSYNRYRNISSSIKNKIAYVGEVDTLISSKSENFNEHILNIILKNINGISHNKALMLLENIIYLKDGDALDNNNYLVLQGCIGGFDNKKIHISNEYQGCILQSKQTSYTYKAIMCSAVVKIEENIKIFENNEILDYIVNNKISFFNNLSLSDMSHISDKIEILTIKDIKEYDNLDFENNIHIIKKGTLNIEHNTEVLYEQKIGDIIFENKNSFKEKSLKFVISNSHLVLFCIKKDIISSYPCLLFKHFKKEVHKNALILGD